MSDYFLLILFDDDVECFICRLTLFGLDQHMVIPDFVLPCKVGHVGVFVDLLFVIVFHSPVVFQVKELVVFSCFIFGCIFDQVEIVLVGL